MITLATSEINAMSELPLWAQQMRAKAKDRFDKTGYPTSSDELWRYTNTSPITSIDWHLALVALVV